MIGRAAALALAAAAVAAAALALAGIGWALHVPPAVTLAAAALLLAAGWPRKTRRRSRHGQQDRPEVRWGRVLAVTALAALVLAIAGPRITWAPRDTPAAHTATSARHPAPGRKLAP